MMSNKFGLNLETVFSYTSGQQKNSLDNAPCTS